VRAGAAAGPRTVAACGVWGGRAQVSGVRTQEHRKAVAAVPRPATVVGSDRRRRRRLAHEGREGGSEGHRGREFGCIIISLIHRY
jgi:hypothetical protein